MVTREASAEERSVLYKAVNKYGLDVVAKRLGMCSESLLRVVGKAPIRAGTLALLRANIDSIRQEVL